MKKLIPVLCILLLIPFSGCLEWHEVIQWNPDGSVNFTLRISVPEFPERAKEDNKKSDEDFEEDIQAFFSSPQGQGLTLIEKKREKLAGLNIFTLQLKAAKFTDINGLYKGLADHPKKSTDDTKKDQESRDAFDELFTKSLYVLKKGKDNTIEVTRSFTPPKVKGKKKKTEKKDGNQLGKQLDEMFLNMFRLRFEVYVPETVSASNAMLSYGRNLRWETTLGYLMKDAYKIQFAVPATDALNATVK